MIKRIFFLAVAALLVAVTADAQTAKQLKVYQKSGVVDTLCMGEGATLSHSRLDLQGVRQPDYVTMEITPPRLSLSSDSSSAVRRYLIADLDSLVLPNGRRVVFIGTTVSKPRLAPSPSNGDGTGFRSSFNGAFPGGDKVTFYWTENDPLRLDNGFISHAEQLSADKTTATFYFDDDGGGGSYQVYFPDRTVTVKSQQAQTGADNSDHIGQSGDCGTADAVYNPESGAYEFTLAHKAAYLCFLPHIDHLPSARITQVDVYCINTIAGNYRLGAEGLYDVTNGSRKTTLTLAPQGQSEFILGSDYTLEQSTCAAYMVIAPQTADRTITMLYHITDTLSRTQRTYRQSLQFRPVANTVYPISYNLLDDEFRAVDLGLSVNWANVNVGAHDPSQQGTAYPDDASAEAALLAETVLTAWVMPTEEQKSELLNKCTWARGEYNGVVGWMVSGARPSQLDGQVHRIFLPCAEGVSREDALASNYRRPVEALEVDLGLTSGTKWASRNVGAANIGDYGDYYAWGETEEKGYYEYTNYSGYKNGTWYNLGNNNDISGTDCDVAHVLWGGLWHIPNQAEWQELMDECTWEWKTNYVNGLNGYLISSQTNQNRIFLPAAGNIRDWNASPTNSTTVAQYPTSERSTNNRDYIWAMNCHYNWNNGKPYFSQGADANHSYRPYGRVVRAVTSPGIAVGDMEFTVVTDAPTWQLGDEQAVIRGTVNAGSAVDELTVGFVIGDSTTIDIDHCSDSREMTMNVAGRFQQEVSLYANLGQWYRAYVKVGDSYYYGEPRHYGWEMVDLDLPSGTRWANMNVGSSSETDFGDYFSWGETTAKAVYNESTYELRKNGVYKDVREDISATEYDAAMAQMGAFWRMPLRADFMELIEHCNCEMVYYNNTTCWKFTSKANARKFIYIPLAGQRNEGSLIDPDYGLYNTSTRWSENLMYYFRMESNGSTVNANNWNYKFRGQPVRAIVNTPQETAGGTMVSVSTRDADWTPTPGESKATLHGTFIASRPLSAAVVGFVIGDSVNITKDDCADMTEHEVDGECSFDDEVDMHDNIGQWYRAYVVVDGEYFYGEAKQYGVVMVDFGLPTKTRWANLNIGAKTPIESGDFFAWGETSPKETYTQANYEYWNGSAYVDISEDISGTQYDAATANWGTLWSMPTEAQTREFLNNTTVSRILIDGVWCQKFTSKNNSNYIIMPQCGEKVNSGTPVNIGNGYYLASQRYDADRNRLFYIYSNVATVDSWNYKWYGQSVRPVVDMSKATEDGLLVNVVTDTDDWRAGDEEVTLNGRFFSATKLSQNVSVGFLVGDDADLDIDHKNAFVPATLQANGSFTATQPLYDDYGQWYRACVQVGEHYYYGEVRQYGIMMVDLGLPQGTLWANVNVGASRQQERGEYFAWGETTPKDVYSVATYDYYKNGAYVDIGSDISGTKYDAATANMGAVWATPTYEQCQELYANCNVERVLVENHWCLKFKSRVNGNYIIMPHDAGHINATSNNGTGNSYNMSSTRYDDSRNWFLLVHSSGSYTSYVEKWLGQPVRAVANRRNEMADGKRINVLTRETSWTWNQSSVTIRGTLGSDKRLSGDITVGFVVGDSLNIDIDHRNQDLPIATVSDTCSFQTTLTLYDNMGQWYRAYARIDGQYYYGEAFHYGLEMVDLGLPTGTRWANMNVGASRPEEYGQYYAWGETRPKESYSPDTYSYYYDNAWHEISLEGDISGTEYDAATANMGGLWRTPTKVECEELYANCDVERVLVENRWCLKFKSRKNHNYILMPHNIGHMNGTSNNGTGNSYYMSSTRYDDSRNWYLLVHSSGSYTSYIEKWLGQPVRAVTAPMLATDGGSRLSITTADNTWAVGDEAVVLKGTLKASAPFTEDAVAVGFLQGDNPKRLTKGQELRDDVVATNVTDSCTFTKSVSLSDNAGHYYRAYVKRSDGTYLYGDVYQYGVIAIDLGLPSGTKWASVNVGASRPWQVGNYYAWGELSPKEEYTADTYSEGLSGKNLGAHIGGNAAYDVARRQLGGEWRMPTQAEYEELYNTSYVSRAFVLYKGQYCYRLTSLANGNAVYLPMGGAMNGTTLSNSYWWAFYWTDTRGDETTTARRTNFYGQGSYDTYSDQRWLGLPVRAVRK